MAHPNLHPLSPIPGADLEGYADEISVAAGDPINFMLSSESPGAGVRLVRLIHGDQNETGPGYKEEEVSWGQPSTLELARQVIDFGSYIEVPDSERLHPHGSFTIALWINPTLVGQGWSTLIAKWVPGELSYAMYIVGLNTLAVTISVDGKTAEWCAAREAVEKDLWQLVAFAYEPISGLVSIYQYFKGSPYPPVLSSKRVRGGPLHHSTAPLLFGATQRPEHSRLHWAHFNGKIGHPVLFGAALDTRSVHLLAGGAEPTTLGEVIAHWDLSKEISGSRIVDVSGNENHGVVVNTPARAVTGPTWEEPPSYLFTERVPHRLYSESPRDYNAVHVHEDDLADAAWDSTLEVAVPRDVRSGIYALVASNEVDRIFLPFIVRPSEPTADTLFLVPTLTWQAYGSNRLHFSFTEDGVLDRGLCIYDVHSDGSPNYYATRLKPTRYWTPCGGFQHFGAHNLPANLYLIDWLEYKGFRYDVVADQDLHVGGIDLLRGYRCLILGSHPEYWTRLMLDTLRHYVRDCGGRVLLLGGNAIYWVTSIDPLRPYLMEVRKSPLGHLDRKWLVPAAGQYQHSTTLEIGGRSWTEAGHSTRSILGVETSTTSSMQFLEGEVGFRRLPASWEDRFAFIFEGVDDEIIGNFGLNLGTAAAGESDTVQEWEWDKPSEPVVLAEASHRLFSGMGDYLLAGAHIAFTPHPNGGAVFAAAAYTWTGSLSHNGYENNVSRITENVLKHFVETPRGA